MDIRECARCGALGDQVALHLVTKIGIRLRIAAPPHALIRAVTIQHSDGPVKRDEWVCKEGCDRAYSFVMIPSDT